MPQRKAGCDMGLYEAVTLLSLAPLIASILLTSTQDSVPRPVVLVGMRLTEVKQILPDKRYGFVILGSTTSIFFRESRIIVTVDSDGKVVAVSTIDASPSVHKKLKNND